MSDLFIGRWISTAERMPPEAGLYITRNPANREPIAAQGYAGGPDPYNDNGGMGWDIGERDMPPHWLEVIVPSADPVCVERVAGVIQHYDEVPNNIPPRLKAARALKALEGGKS